MRLTRIRRRCWLCPGKTGPSKPIRLPVSFFEADTGIVGAGFCFKNPVILKTRSGVYREISYLNKKLTIYPLVS
ncbi:MAG: hypothetical protein BZ151_06685 [Desulfobacca sp. 4484_104]|nr:MAG: hypothetical protein BZ151_06685 [Desulfobacca sp. 4484_104]RLA89492.1 MAG: hypothetical protein DRG58_04830 [Deltaproteobacteria bacterium]